MCGKEGLDNRDLSPINVQFVLFGLRIRILKDFFDVYNSGDRCGFQATIEKGR